MYSSLFADLNNTITILTPNRRLSVHLHDKYSEFQQVQNKLAWETPDILPVSAWVKRTWEEFVFSNPNLAKPVLTPIQAQTVWQQIIRDSEYGSVLFDLPGTAKLAQQAWETLLQWRTTINHEAFTQSEDSLAFQQWSLSFQTWCDENHWFDRAVIPDLLADNVTNLQLLTDSIFFVGFEELSPQLEFLFEQLISRDMRCEHFSGETFSSNVSVLPLANERTEIETLARWAKKISADNPNASIACVIPNLNNIRDQVEHIFKATFIPEEILPGTENIELPFNISAGKPLSEFSPVFIALKLLTLFYKPIPLEDLSCIIRSGYLGDALGEQNDRALLDLDLRGFGNSEYTLKSLLAALPPSAKATGGLRCAYAHLERSIYRGGLKQSPSDWSNTFATALNACGWPGEQTLSSIDYQAVHRWNELLQEFSSLSWLTQSMNFSEALNSLKQLANQTQFQTQTPQTKIQILGMLEAAGVEFDYLWLTGLHDANWPAAAKPNPFIPLSLQKQLRMPHASAERELLFSTNLTKRFSHSAKEIIFSYPEFEDDRLLSPSPLISELPVLNIEQLPLASISSFAAMTFNQSDLESIVDEKGPAIENNTSVSGGTNILKHQAACPFKAFAELRLHADGIPSVEIGLNVLERGSILHAALENIWGEIKSHQQLCAYSDNELLQIIQDSISQAITTNTQHKQFPKNSRFLKIEKKRLEVLLTQWLELEKAREPFIVSAIEQKKEISIGKLVIKTRIDRVDTLANNEKVLIDYKTGKTSIGSWFGERPDEPQLPLYSIAEEDPIAAIAYAQVRTDAMQFKGIANNEEIIPKVDDISDFDDDEIEATMQTQIKQWKKTLEKLANSFCNGDAEVDPNHIGSCMYCDLQPLCRVGDR